MIKACIFDFDGVVVDSERKYHYLAWQWVAKEIGGEFSYEEYCPFKSAGRAKVIPFIFNKAGKQMQEGDIEKYSRIRQEKIDVAFKDINSKDIMPGIIDYVNYLKNNGLKVAVASASTSSHLVAKKLGIFDMFEVFVDGEAQLAHKPSPDIFLHTAKLLNVEPNECVVFEDSINGVIGAKSAGMHCVGVQTYFTDLADRIIDDFIGADLSLTDF